MLLPLLINTCDSQHLLSDDHVKFNKSDLNVVILDVS